VAGSWPGFRGAGQTNVAGDGVRLATSWPAGGPRRLWSAKLGEGHAGAAVAASRVFILDYDQAARADKLRCFALADGRELWAQSYPVDIKRNHGMSRTVPAVSGKYVISLGPKCHVLCADTQSGRVYWKKDLVAEYGTTVPPWYAGQCPLIDGNRVLIAPGGSALMIAVDLASGKVLWKTPNPKGWKMTHSSIIPLTVGGQKMYVYCASGGVVGVSATTGAILWETTDWTVSTANVPTPVPLGDGRVFLTGGYNAGAMLLKISGSGGSFKPEVVYRLPATVWGSGQHTPVLYQGHLYGVIPDGQLACLSLDGKRLWASGPTNRFGLGPYLVADGKIVILGDKGDLVLAAASPEGYQPLARAKVLAGPDAWAPLALAGGRLLARDLTNLICLDLKG
jgi:outer membrane protein assembly factor BamB